VLDFLSLPHAPSVAHTLLLIARRTSLFVYLRVMKSKYVDVLHHAGITRVPLEHIVL
jgi:hypothetical protein